VLGKPHHQARLDRHAGAEFERGADRVAHMQGAALVRGFDERRRQAGALEIVLGPLEIILAIDPQAHALAHRRVRARLEDEAVMTGLLDAAQIECLSVVIADREAQRVAIEGAAQPQVLDGQNDMARPRGVERRRIRGTGNGHGEINSPAAPWRAPPRRAACWR
jgi:hypothetical protein